MGVCVFACACAACVCWWVAVSIPYACDMENMRLYLCFVWCSPTGICVGKRTDEFIFRCSSRDAAAVAMVLKDPTGINKPQAKL